MKQSESQVQRESIRWFAHAHSRLWNARRLHSVPNGGKRGKATAAVLRLEGQMPGVWDLQLTMPRGQYAGLFIEMKCGSNGLAKEQKEFQQAHEGEYRFAVCRSVEDFMAAITEYLALPAAFNSIAF